MAQAVTDNECGALVAMAVVESLTAVLVENDGAAVSLALEDTTREAVVSPVPTRVGASDDDCSTVGDASPLAEGEGSALLAGDVDACPLTDADGPKLVLTPWDAPALGDA